MNGTTMNGTTKMDEDPPQQRERRPCYYDGLTFEVAPGRGRDANAGSFTLWRVFLLSGREVRRTEVCRSRDEDWLREAGAALLRLSALLGAPARGWARTVDAAEVEKTPA